jgi:hypothetical protein
MAGPLLQWELNKSVDSSLPVARGVIQASTSDNVQTLALLACERFGATLAICPETCRKVEAHIIRLQTPTSAAVNFLSSVIGYSKDDCASQLARSLAGVQFIGLATVLVTSIGAFHGGEALAHMLRNSASDKTLLPPARHLKDLLASIEHRCVQLKFPDMISGWSKILLDSSITTPKDRALWKNDSFVPNAEGLGGLVNAFRQLSRVGNATSITLKTLGCTAWVAAFTQWCLGVPPSIYLDDGTAILVQPKSNVTIIASKGPSECSELEIIIHQSMGNPSDLITAEKSGKPWSGMLSIEAHGQWLLCHYDFDDGSAHRAITQLLPYAMKDLVSLLRMSSPKRFDHWQEKRELDPYEDIPDEVIGLATYPFPSDITISNMLFRMLGSSDCRLSSLKDGLVVTDLPLVSLHIESLKRNCSCKTCSPTGLAFELCRAVLFMRHVSSFAADVLLLSLFDTPEALLVCHGNHSLRDLTEAIYKILTTGKPSTIPLIKVLQAALSVVGHDVDDGLNQDVWILSCYKGQAVYPRLFETHRLQDSGYLTLSWAPGLLRYEGEVYPKVIGDRGATELLGRRRVNDIATNAVNIPVNLVPNQRLVWRITRGDGFLLINAGLELDGTWITMMNSPLKMLINLSFALVASTCPHPANKSLKSADKWSQYTEPSEPLGSPEAKSDPNTVSVVAVDGNDGLRMYTLGVFDGPFPVVIRNGACIACCLEICRTAGHRAIIC